MTVNHMAIHEPLSDAAPPRRPPRATARARIFFGAFAVACAVGLAYTFARPAVYQSTAGLLIAPPKPVSVQETTVPAVAGESQTVVNAANGDAAPASAYVLTELQRLSGPQVIDGVVHRLQAAGKDRVSRSALQGMLHAAPVPGTDIVRLSARGHDRTLLPAALDAWIASYLELWGKVDNDSAAQNLTQLQDEVTKLKAQVDRKRGDLDDFRARYGIVSMDSNDNEALAKLTGLNKALADARNAQALAEANLLALQQSIAEGQPLLLSDDKQNLAALEQHATDLREQIAERQSGFTPQYMALDQKYQSLKESLTRIEAQIKEKRAESQAAALEQANQAVTSARDTVARLTQQQQDIKQAATEFTARFNQQKSLQDELDRLDGLYSAAQDRLVAMQAAGRGLHPQVSVLDRPSQPIDPIAPDYRRDAAISLGAALLFALLAVWFVEFLNRPTRPTPALYPVLEPRIQIANFQPSAPPPPAMGHAEAPARLTGPAAHDTRELSPAEIGALLDAANGQVRVLIAALLSGLALDDLAGLGWEAVTAQGTLVLSGGRSYALRPPLRRLLEALRAVSDGGPIFRDPQGAALSAADLDGLVVCAAHDAGVAAPAAIDARALRHTYVAYLVRQGLRLGELATLVGHVPPAQLAAYGRLSPPGRGRSPQDVDVELPALLAAAT